MDIQGEQGGVEITKEKGVRVGEEGWQLAFEEGALEWVSVDVNNMDRRERGEVQTDCCENAWVFDER